MQHRISTRSTLAAIVAMVSGLVIVWWMSKPHAPAVPPAPSASKLRVASTVRKPGPASAATPLVPSPLEPDPAPVSDDGADILGRAVDADSGAPIANIRMLALGTNETIVKSTTNRDGHFAFAGLTEGFWAIKPDDLSWTLSNRPCVARISPRHGPIDVELRLAPAAQVSGRVVDADTGQGIPDVVVSARVTPQRHGITDATGAYTIRGLGNDVYEVQPIQAPRHVMCEGRPLRIRPGDWIDNMDFTLSKGLPVDGVVRDAAGAPVPKASVGVTNSKTGKSVRGERTGPDGTFRIVVPAAPGESLLLEAAFQNACGQRIIESLGEAGASGALVTLQSPGIVSGFVVDGRGQAFPFVKVQLRQSENKDGWWKYAEVSDDRGEFTIKDVRPGTYRVRAIANQFEETPDGQNESKVEVRSGQRSAAVRVLCTDEPGCIVWGHVTDTTGKPVANLQVRVKQAPMDVSRDEAGREARAETNNRGEYLMAALPPGPYALSASPVGAAPAPTHTVLPVEGPVDLVVPAPLVMVLNVVRADNGAPIADCQFQLAPYPISKDGSAINAGALAQQRLREPAMATSQYNEHGRFVLQDIPEGDQLVAVSSEGFFPQVQLVPHNSIGAAPSATFRLRPGGIIEGIVKDESGNPVSGASVFLDVFLENDHVIYSGPPGRVPDYYAKAWSRHDGSFLIESAPDGAYSIGARWPGHEMVTAHVDFKGGQSVHVEITPLPENPWIPAKPQ